MFDIEQMIHYRNIKRSADGLSLMLLFTIVWTCIAEIALDSWYYRSVGLVFVVVAVLFLIQYLRFRMILKPVETLNFTDDSSESKKREKWFTFILIAEGLLILIARNILVNIQMPQLFIPCLALIVGLHFYPLGKIFGRKIDYAIATWMTVLSFSGIILSLYHTADQNMIDSFIGFGCAIGTSAMGGYMIAKGRLSVKMLEEDGVGSVTGETDNTAGSRE